MIYDVVEDINLPGKALRFAAGESVPHARLGDALAAMLLEEGSIVEQAAGEGVPPVEPEREDEQAAAARLEAYMRYSYPERYAGESAPEPEQEAEPLTEPDPEPEAVEEEDDYGR